MRQPSWGMPAAAVRPRGYVSAALPSVGRGGAFNGHFLLEVYINIDRRRYFRIQLKCYTAACYMFSSLQCTPALGAAGFIPHIECGWILTAPEFCWWRVAAA